METFRFKTTLKCGGCVAAITPFLDKLEGVDSWEVDIGNPERILTVRTSTLQPVEIISAIRAAGYQAEKV